MINLGTVRPGSTIFIPFETFEGSTGAPITLTGLATSDIKVYKDGGTTERASASGFTLLDSDGIDFDSLTGIHGVSIDLSDNTTADFWKAGSQYFVVIGDVTVDSQTMRFLAASFRIGQQGALFDTSIATLASQTSFTLTHGPAEDDALNGLQAIIHDAASAVQCGRAIIADYTGSTKTVTLVGGTTFTAAAGDNISIFPQLAPLTPATIGRTAVVDAAGAVSADVTKISGDSTAADNAESFFDGFGYGPLLIRTTVNTVNSQTDLTLSTSYLAASMVGSRIVIRDTTGQIIQGKIDTITAGEQVTFTRDGNADFVIVSSDVVEILAPSYGPADRTAATTAQGTISSGTHGLAALKTLIDTLDDFVDTEVAAIKAKTDNLPSDPADASVIAALIAALPTAVEIVAAIQAAAASYEDSELKQDLDNLSEQMTVGGVKLDLTQAVPNTNTAGTTGDALNAARAQGFGKWSLNSSTKVLTLYGADGTTVIKQFAVGPNLSSPLTRTPQ